MVINPNKTKFIQFVFFPLILLSFLTPNIELTILSVVTLASSYILLHREGEPPILLFIVLFQWLQASIKIFYANIQGLTLLDFQNTSDYHRAPGESVETAIQLSLFAIIVLSLGISIVIKKLPVRNKKKLYNELKNIKTNKLIIIYFSALLISSGLHVIASAIPQLRQPLIALASIKWAIFYILSINVFFTHKKRTVFVFIILLEFVLGVSGIFSEFKQLFFYLIISFLTIKDKLEIKTVFFSSLIGLIFFFVAVVWTGVKGEQRSYMFGNKRGTWTVKTSKTENILHIYDLVSNFTKEQFDIAVDALVDRVSYVDYFAFSIKQVPKVIPHEGGVLWENAILNILKPRLLFPDKKELSSDSELTMKYTGLRLASEGASFSIGYIGESYIDFGKYIMFFPVFILGLYYGFIYKYFLTRNGYTFWTYATAVSVIIIVYRMEIASIKLVGMITISFLFYVLFNIFFKKWFNSLFINKK